ncbi:hypothetical protein RND71_017613 [Anisodus tanguticus]|uniref:Cyclic nucleotide-binding domain-containing protein n=1 Tax=Anisodus tanguticus TaxID=243964 RepID=A0AAE1S427_9SOLA|nr:hypothetical protein RND71_017613 [Anisodus tanguticus]
MDILLLGPKMNSLQDRIHRFKTPASLFYDDQKAFYAKIHDPNGEFVTRWNHIFLFTSFVGLFIDPLFLLLPIIRETCISTDSILGIIIVAFRVLVDLFAILQIYLKFRTAYVSKKTRFFGKGELVMDKRLIAIRYLKTDFVIDVAAALPLPQVLGAIWYLMSIERHFSCWKDECEKKQKGAPDCNRDYLDCSSFGKPGRQEWSETTKVFKNCDANGNIKFEFGMFSDANTEQSYLQSMTARLEQWRVKRRDTEEWMRHRQLPEDLQDRVRRFVQYKWLATRGVEEEEILRSLPLDLRRQIQRHLCLALVRRVPFFSQMDDQLLDAICGCLVSSLNTKDTYIVREGDPVNEMLFIIRGQLESSTTNGGRSGFFNSITLNNGDFCGEELLTWALVPNPNLNLPTSTRTVKCLTEVEAFALRAEKLKFVANQFRRLHSKKLQHAFRFYSHQWRTWGACYIQAAWRRHKRKKLADELSREESLYYRGGMDQDDDYGQERPQAGGNAPDHAAESSIQHLGATILASRFAANTRRGKVARVDPGESSLRMPKLFKPDEPDFSDDPSH